MSSTTRDRILRTLRLRGKCTVNELAEAAGVSPVSVRHHLANLLAENLVESEEVKHGVGRPRLLFALSDTALEMFPSRYFRLTSRELSCPYYRMGREHPEVCVIDQTFIATSLSLPVERVSCLLEGDSHCSFSIPVGVAEVGKVEA